MEQFFENQKKGKTAEEINALEHIRRSWAQKREKMESQKIETQSTLRNVRYINPA